MTIGTLMERLRAVRTLPTEEQAIYEELARLESMIRTEIMGGKAVAFTVGEDEDTALTVGPPYDQMYEHYLCAMLDQKCMEYETAQTELAIFSGLYTAYAAACRRERLPEDGSRVHGYV